MRIIAGEFRGRKLVEPRFDVTRPITDRAKQSLFDVLMPLIEDAVVYDCFCGTGSMGLECLSRGARHATFFDADRHALSGLRQNIESLRVSDRTKMVAGDLFRLAPRLDPVGAIGLFFFNPPFKFLREKPEPLQKFIEAMLPKLAVDATVIFRHDTADELALPPLRQVDRRVYSNMTIDLLRV
ncbi:MAG: RsmD family RNA methyltransferase [Tepidisphaeraceae bacterium]